MDLQIKWKDKLGAWQNFPMGDILHLSVKHACHLFNNPKYPVRAKQGEMIIVNTDGDKTEYRKRGKQCTTFQAILDTASAGLDRPLSETGFIL